MDIQPSSGVSLGESMEEQRNWSDKKWAEKEKDSIANYDRSRTKLNFEIGKGGVVKEVDSSISIDARMRQNLEDRNIKIPVSKPGSMRPRRVIAQIIFGGSRDDMHRLAFGMQAVDLSKSGENSHIERREGIERWAKDTYDFVCRKFGEENIVGFYVHLDETNPHIHCSVIPVKDNKVNWKGVFGEGTVYEVKKKFAQLHTDYANEVGAKYGLERGCSMEETKARHISTEEYRLGLIREVNELSDKVGKLNKEIASQERAMKGLQTMISNLEGEREKILLDIEEAKDFSEKENEERSDNLQYLKEQLQKIDDKLADKNTKLSEAQERLDAAKEMLGEVKEEQKNLQETNRKIKNENDTLRAKNQLLQERGKGLKELNTRLGENMQAKYEQRIDRAVVAELVDAFRELIPNLSPQQVYKLEQKGIPDIVEMSNEVFTTALFLVAGYPAKAAEYADLHGGVGPLGGTGNWMQDRRKDEDDLDYWRRCVGMATYMMRPARRGRSR